MLRRVTSSNLAVRAVPVATLIRGHYSSGPFTNPTRRNQLTDEERAKVVIDQSQWPENFKDYDPQDPYKKFPDWIEGLTSFNLFLAGIEAAFVVVFWECVFPKTF